MAQSDRDIYTSDITEESNVSDGYGGVSGGTPVVVIADYKFSAWTPKPYQRIAVLTQYGLRESSTIIRVSGPFNALIVEGQYIQFEGSAYKLVGVRPVNGSGSSPRRCAIVAVREEG